MVTGSAPTLSEELRAGRRALDGLPGVAILGDWAWDGRIAMWVLRCRLAPAIDPTLLVPAVTEWYILVDREYPWGTIQFFPAKQGGLAYTFPHQKYNGEGSPRVAWRTGDICLDTTVRVLGRNGGDREPAGVHERLAWRFRRALDWLVAASRDDLISVGEPFELPHFPQSGDAQHMGASPDDPDEVVFTEGQDTFLFWGGLHARTGPVDLMPLGKRSLAVTHFRTRVNRVALEPHWGHAIAKVEGIRSKGLWLHLNEIPVLPPWQAPATWGELRAACCRQGLALDELLSPALDRLRDGRRHVALLGFPIPALVGDPPSRMHWQALLLPPLAYGPRAHSGFRPGKEGYWRLDRRTVLRDDAALDWLTSENWHVDELATRGRLPVSLTAHETLVLGVGALGAVIGELLARGGGHRLILMDGDRMQAGNLVRHPLTLDNLNQDKAVALASRLNRTSPHAAVTALPGRFPPQNNSDRIQVRRCSIVLDCTAENATVQQLSELDWEEPILFASFSLNLGAGRLYCYTTYGRTFPAADFFAAIATWVARDGVEGARGVLPRAGIGCWHPVFPARADDIWLLAATAVKHLESCAADPSIQPRLVVFEQYEERGTFGGIRRIDAA